MSCAQLNGQQVVVMSGHLPHTNVTGACCRLTVVGAGASNHQLPSVRRVFHECCVGNPLRESVCEASFLDGPDLRGPAGIADRKLLTHLVICRGSDFNSHAVQSHDIHWPIGGRADNRASVVPADEVLILSEWFDAGYLNTSRC